MFGSRKAKKEIDKLIKNRPKYQIQDEAFETQSTARSQAFGRDRSIQMQETNLEKQAAQSAAEAKSVTSNTSDLLSTIAAIDANKTAAFRGLAQDEASLQNQKMQQLYNANQMMVDEKDKAWNYNVNMPYQLQLQRQQEKLRRAQMVTDAFSGVAIAVGGSAATSGTTQTGGSGSGEGNSAGGLAGMFSSIFSDKRLKTDIKPMDKGLDVVLRMQPVQFKYVRPMDGDQVHLGFIAQEVQESLPEIVKEVEYGADKRLSLNYSEIIPVLVNAVKELSVKLDAVEQQNKWLKEEINFLKTPVI